MSRPSIITFQNKDNKFIFSPCKTHLLKKKITNQQIKLFINQLNLKLNDKLFAKEQSR